MSVFRVHRNEHYGTMSNFHLRDTSLSWQAMGMLSFMLSNSKEFKYSIQGLAHCASNGEASVRSTLKELREHGYVNVYPVTDERGRISDWEYDIYEEPHVDSPDVENPHVDNEVQSNNNISNDYISSPTSSTPNNNLNNKRNINISKKVKKELDLSFVSIHFEDVFNKWLNFHKEIKKPYTQSGAEACYQKLLELSGNDPSTAQKIVEQSIANNYQGLFPLKQNGNSNQPVMSLGAALNGYLSSVGYRG